MEFLHAGSKGGHAMKILLAEADGALAGRLFHLLVKNSYQTTAVKTGQAALDEIGRSYFDMVIAEASTPAVDGCARPAARRPCCCSRSARTVRPCTRPFCRARTTVLSSRSMTTSYCCASRRCSRARGTGRGRCRNLSFLSSTTLDPKRASAAVHSDCRACACEKTYAQVQKEQSSRGARGGKARLE